MNMKLYLPALVLLLPLFVDGQTRNARISGQVRDERLRPVAGARIDVSLVPDPGAKVKPFLAATLTRSDGMFQIDVPAGTISVCAALPNSDLLDTCVWDAPLRPVVGAGKTVQLKPIMLRRGYLVAVRIEDAGAVIANSLPKGPLAKRQVLVGVALPNGGYLPAPLSLKSPTRRVHQLLVPRDTPVSLSVFAKGLNVADAKGLAIASDKAHKIDLKVGSDHSQREFVYSIQGARP
jgi:hypothetical protein